MIPTRKTWLTFTTRIVAVASKPRKLRTKGNKTIPATIAIGKVKESITRAARSIFSFIASNSPFPNISESVGSMAVAIDVPINVSGTCMIHQP